MGTAFQKRSVSIEGFALADLDTPVLLVGGSLPAWESSRLAHSHCSAWRRRDKTDTGPRSALYPGLTIS